MPSRDTLVWFARGFALTALALLLVAALVIPAAGWAQGGGNSTSPQAAVGGSQPPWRTDDPLGRTPSPLPDAEPAPNDQWAAGLPADSEPAGAGMTTGMEPQAVYGSPLVIPAADFREDGFHPGTAWYQFGSGYWQGTASAYGCLMAPAYLPAGATVATFWASLVDNATAAYVNVSLHRVDNYSGAHVTMASISTSGVTSTIQNLFDLSIVSPTVYYPTYSYYVTTCLPSANTRLYSVRIYYTLP
jgi:hypothetical protein